jgi:hypothetical protein
MHPLARALATLFCLLELASPSTVFGATPTAPEAAVAPSTVESAPASERSGNGRGDVTGQGANEPTMAAAGPGTHAPPSDAPSVDANSIRRPDPPAGFNRHDAGWIHFAYPPEARQRIQRLIEIADATRLELSIRLGASVLNDLHVRVARTAGEMTTLAPQNAPYPKYATGVAYPDLRLVLITLDPRHPNERHDILETFKHELAHVALHDAVKGHDVPRWFNEGFAVYVSGEGSIPRLQTLWTASLAGNIIPLDRLERSFPDDAILASIAYAQAADLVRYLVRTQEQYRFDGLVERIARGMSFDQALLAAYGIDRMTLESEWREDIARRYTFWPVLTGSTLLWVGIVGLFFWGYRRRRLRDRRTLERWRREEAAEDAILSAAAAARAEHRIHIVVGQPSTSMTQPQRPLTGSEPEIPKVEHNGSLHTLH